MENGVWRTIRGRRVFIRDGEDLESAMKRSGKFGTKFSPEETENLRKTGREARAREIDKVNEPKSNLSNKEKEILKDAIERNDVKEGTPLQKIADDRVHDIEETLNNDKILLNYARRKELNGIDGTSIKDLESRIEQKEKYLSVAKSGNDEDSSSMSEWSDTVGDGYSDAQRKAYNDYLLKTQGTTNEDLINAGREPENRVSIEKFAKEQENEKTFSNEKAQSFINAFETALKEEQDGYTQTVDWDGGTYQYSKDRLDRMEDAGMKPLEHSYTGGGWQGTKYDSKLTTKEIAKTVQSDLKKEFPDVKISRKTDYNSIDINIMSSEKDLYASSSDIDKMSDSQVSDTIRDSIGGYTRMDDWLEKNNRKSANGTFTVNDEKDYLKEELETYRNRVGSRVTGNEWYLSEYGKKVVGSLNKNLNSYNYDDSDGMVDYFDTNFYGGVNIGKWDKPYVVENKKIEAKVERFKNRKNKQ